MLIFIAEFVLGLSIILTITGIIKTCAVYGDFRRARASWFHLIHYSKSNVFMLSMTAQGIAVVLLVDSGLNPRLISVYVISLLLEGVVIMKLAARIMHGTQDLLRKKVGES